MSSSGAAGQGPQALEVETADVVKLVLQFCKENRLLHTMRTLQEEAQVNRGRKKEGTYRPSLHPSIDLPACPRHIRPSVPPTLLVCFQPTNDNPPRWR